VERALRQVRERRERERLQRQLQQTNQELQMRVRELTTIFSIGKAVTSITDSSLLFERILEGAIKVTQGELGWFLLREESAKSYRLAAQRGLPPSYSERTNQSWDDGISSLVALSGESLSIHGEPLKRFKISAIGQAALVIPVKIQKQAIGLLVVMRKQPQAFSSSEQHLAEAVADYASISLVNAQLFRTVEERARSLENMAGIARAGEKINSEILTSVKGEVRNATEIARTALDRLVKDPAARWNSLQRQDLSVLQEQLKNVGRVAEAISPIQLPQAPSTHPLANLADLARQAGSRYQHFAQQNNLTLVSDIITDSLVVEADAAQITQVLHGLLSNAIKFSIPGGQVTLKVERTADGLAHVIVTDTGVGIDPAQVARIFDPAYRPQESRPRRFGGLGIGLTLVREIITNQKGKIWVESKPGNGTRFHFTLSAIK
jgi:signal transduction histidine kinase